MWNDICRSTGNPGCVFQGWAINCKGLDRITASCWVHGRTGIFGEVIIGGKKAAKLCRKRSCCALVRRARGLNFGYYFKFFEKYQHETGLKNLLQETTNEMNQMLCVNHHCNILWSIGYVCPTRSWKWQQMMRFACLQQMEIQEYPRTVLFHFYFFT